MKTFVEYACEQDPTLEGLFPKGMFSMAMKNMLPTPRIERIKQSRSIDDLIQVTPKNDEEWEAYEDKEIEIVNRIGNWIGLQNLQGNPTATQLISSKVITKGGKLAKKNKKEELEKRRYVRKR
ncbi:MAG: hypothetical protein ACW99G_17840 [Candidatus Thorarchaeota archaeon]|jgi:hypothetical protein